MAEVFEGSSENNPSESKPFSADDWGIPSDDELLPSDQSEDEPSVAANNRKRPLKLGKNGRVYTQEMQFRSALRAIFSAKVTAAETDRYMEQFRFIIISSSMLEQQPIFTCWSPPADLRRERLLYNKPRPWVKLHVQTFASFGGPTSLSAIVYYLHLRYRDSASQVERSAVAVVIFFVVVIYLFASSRRRLLRSIREKVLCYSDMALQAAKFLDGDITKVLKELQEIDLCAGGFAPNSQPNFFANGTSAARAPNGRELRSILASVLNLGLESYSNAFKACISLVNMSDFTRFLAIYGVADVMADYGFELDTENAAFSFGERRYYSGAESCFCSVGELKQEFRKLHFCRRVLLCALLAVPCDETPQGWTIIADQMLHINNLSEQLSQLISAERFAPATTADRAPPSPALFNVMARVKHLNARLDIISEAKRESSDYHINVRAVTDELNDLKAQWDAFVSDSGPANSTCVGSLASTNTIASPTLVGTPEMDSTVISSLGPADVESSASTELNNPSVFEGEAPSLLALSGPKLSREERIELARKHREEVKGREPSLHTSLAHELTRIMTLRSQRQ